MSDIAEPPGWLSEILSPRLLSANGELAVLQAQQAGTCCLCFPSERLLNHAAPNSEQAGRVSGAQMQAQPFHPFPAARATSLNFLSAGTPKDSSFMCVQQCELPETQPGS